MFGNIGMPELIVVMIIVLLVFGAGRVPEIARSLGSAVDEFKKGMSGGGAESAAKPVAKSRRARSRRA